MYFQKDWLLRQIEMLAQFVSRLVFGRDHVQYEIPDEAHLTDTDRLYQLLLRLIAEERYGEAEDALFEKLDGGDPAQIRLALDFYGRLNELSDEQLENGRFPREEIDSGLRAAMRACGIAEPTDDAP